MITTHLTGLESCNLHRRTPYGIAGVRQTQFSIARFYGSIKFNGDSFTYFPDTDELIRDDVLRWKCDLKKKSPSPARSSSDETTAANSGGIIISSRPKTINPN